MNTSQTFPATHNPELLNLWSATVPQVALDNENLLYWIISISALHLLKTSGPNPGIVAERQQYTDLALREHRKSVSQLCAGNAEAVCIAAALVLIDIFATLQDRVIEDDYDPPMDWVSLTFSRATFPIPDNLKSNLLLTHCLTQRETMRTPQTCLMRKY